MMISRVRYRLYAMCSLTSDICVLSINFIDAKKSRVTFYLRDVFDSI
jgi:hypothetical protein